MFTSILLFGQDFFHPNGYISALPDFWKHRPILHNLAVPNISTIRRGEPWVAVINNRVPKNVDEMILAGL